MCNQTCPKTDLTPSNFSVYREQPERREVVIFMLVNKPEHSVQNKESSLNEEDGFLPYFCHYIQINDWMTVRVIEHISNQIPIYYQKYKLWVKKKGNRKKGQGFLLIALSSTSLLFLHSVSKVPQSFSVPYCEALDVAISWLRRWLHSEGRGDWCPQH